MEKSSPHTLQTNLNTISGLFYLLHCQARTYIQIRNKRKIYLKHLLLLLCVLSVPLVNSEVEVETEVCESTHELVGIQTQICGRCRP